MNVSDFQPEMSVKLESGVVMVHAARDETLGDGGSTYRLMRQFVLPHRVDPDRVTSLLTRAGQLVIGAPVAAITVPALNQTGVPEVKAEAPEVKVGIPEVKVGTPEIKVETPEAKTGAPGVRVGAPEAKAET
ncbi:body wall muscle protein HR-29-like [Pollicipes pollicipes]|uniref:body wall muscle protein HR-29-like n=1 Tax=Pollicipes pollicipes TaxID=41117 RepID=UPI001884FC4F|nr:body wall muscle protein HR-29-like [Pollicipes pollicipes]